MHHTVHKRNFRHSRGYTMLEIMLVLGIISILVSAAIFKMKGNLDVARIQRVDADLQTIKTQLQVYEMQNLILPTTSQGLEALVKKPTTEPLPRRWLPLMEEVPLDPWGTPYQYLNPGRQNPAGYDIYSLGPDRKESDDDLPQKQT